jgi:predicted secreted protein
MFAGVNWFTAAVLYVLIWWTVLFAVLPFGTRPVADADAATGWRGAPENPRIGRKLLWTTLIATTLCGAFLVVQATGLISFRSGWLALPEN